MQHASSCLNIMFLYLYKFIEKPYFPLEVWFLENTVFGFPNGRRTHSNHFPIDSINGSRRNSTQRFTYILQISNINSVSLLSLGEKLGTQNDRKKTLGTFTIIFPLYY